MTRQPHDQFAKQYLKELISPFGTVEINREVTGEVRKVDIYFSPMSKPPTSNLNLGVLGKILLSACLIEPFRNQRSFSEVRSCLLKLFSFQSELQREAKRNQKSIQELDLPNLWILAPSASEKLINSFGFQLDPENWSSGVYISPVGWKTNLIAINQLPVIPETLWLRILGKGKTQEEAILELVDLSPENLLINLALEQVSLWRINLETKQDVTSEERELIMNLSPAYLKWREDVRQEGRQEGRQEERKLVLESLLKARFGELDQGLLEVVETLLKLSADEYAKTLIQLLNLSREEILELITNEQ